MATDQETRLRNAAVVSLEELIGKHGYREAEVAEVVDLAASAADVELDFESAGPDIEPDSLDD